MAEYIDRKAALAAMREYEIDLSVYAAREVDVFWDDAITTCCECVENLPSADVPHWIPCSERLPEEDGEYLVTDVSGGVATVTETYFITDCDGDGHWGALDVIAWMPLPEPYKEET